MLDKPLFILWCMFWQERRFLENQQENMERSMKRLADQHREKVAMLEQQFLQQKQQLLRGQAHSVSGHFIFVVFSFQFLEHYMGEKTERQYIDFS